MYHVKRFSCFFKKKGNQEFNLHCCLKKEVIKRDIFFCQVHDLSIFPPFFKRNRLWNCCAFILIWRRGSCAKVRTREYIFASPESYLYIYIYIYVSLTLSLSSRALMCHVIETSCTLPIRQKEGRCSSSVILGICSSHRERICNPIEREMTSRSEGGRREGERAKEREGKR